MAIIGCLPWLEEPPSRRTAPGNCIRANQLGVADVQLASALFKKAIEISHAGARFTVTIIESDINTKLDYREERRQGQSSTLSSARTATGAVDCWLWRPQGPRRIG